MEQYNESKGFIVASVISLVFSGLGMLSLFMTVVMFFYAGSGNNSTAVINEAVLGILGIMFFVAGSWIFGLIGLIMGIIVTIVGLVKKQFRQIWIPIVSAILGIILLIGPVIILLAISA